MNNSDSGDTAAEMLSNIRDNLGTTDEWDIEDYRDFYGRDVPFLISLTDSLRARIAELERERDHWKANHDNQVALKAAVLNRPDLGEDMPDAVARTAPGHEGTAMSDDELTFHRAISKLPGEDLPRLIYADWLEEQNRRVEAAIIRCSKLGPIELNPALIDEMRKSNFDLASLVPRLPNGFRVLWHDWHTDFDSPEPCVYFIRGLIGGVVCEPAWWAANHREYREIWPIERVHFTNTLFIRPELHVEYDPAKKHYILYRRWDWPAAGVADERRVASGGILDMGKLRRVLQSVTSLGRQGESMLAQMFPGIRFELPPYEYQDEYSMSTLHRPRGERHEFMWFDEMITEPEAIDPSQIIEHWRRIREGNPQESRKNDSDGS